MPQDKIRSTCREIRSVFSKNKVGKLTVRKFCSLLGKLNSLSGAVVSAQLHLWPLHHLMRQQLARVRYQDTMHLNSQVIEETQLLVDTLHSLGFGIHPDKCFVIPSRSAEFLGTQVNSRKMQFRVPRDKIRSTRREIRSVFSENEVGKLTVRKFCSLLGKLNSLSGAVVPAQLNL